MKRNRQFDELLARVPEETKRRVEKQMTCKWLRNGEECGKGLPGTPCEVDGCVAWEHYEPADAMKLLDEKIKKVSKEGIWDGVDVDKYMDEVRGRDTDLLQASRELVEAVEKYIQPKKGEFLSRIGLLVVLRKVKKVIYEGK